MAKLSTSTRPKAHGGASKAKVPKAKSSVVPPRHVAESKIMFRVKGLAHVVGGTLPRLFYKRWNFKHLDATLVKLSKDEAGPGDKVFMYLQTESIDPNDASVRRDGEENVPIFIVVICRDVPTTLTTTYSVQSEGGVVLTDMSEHSMHWTHVETPLIAGGLRVLSCHRPMTNILAEYMLLHLKRPRELAAESPENVTTVSIRWESEDVVWSVEEETVDDCVEEIVEDEGWDPDVKPEIKDFLLAELTKQKQLAYALHHQKTTTFDGMIRQIAEDKSPDGAATASIEEETRRNLDAMKVWKIYPANKELEPIMTSFGTTKGFQKNHVFNRFFGRADDFFPKSK